MQRLVQLLMAPALLCATNVVVSAGDSAPKSDSTAVPVRGLHVMAPAASDIGMALEFIRTVLPQRGVNTLILEFDYSFNYRSRPEFANPHAPGQAEVRQLADACRAEKIELIPQLNCLGHQSWSERNGTLLQKHPEVDETPGKYPQNKGIYCRSYCPLHPDVHAILFDLMDELVDACQAKAFHVGMDEVFILADPDCQRCKGKNPAEVFADEVRRLRDHLAQKQCRTWLWGDRFLDAKATGLGKWEASENATAPAIDLVPKDLVICDWHYDRAPDTPRLFAAKGFEVVSCPWRKTNVALGELELIRAIRNGTDQASSGRARGMLQTTWCGFRPFVEACRTELSGATTNANSAAQSARCFLALSAQWGRNSH